MRWLLPAACLLLAAPVLAGGTGVPLTGPWAGVLTEGESDTHTYDNNPTNQNCIQIVRPYTVTVEATPGAVLEVQAGWHSFVADPVGSVTFLAGVCTQFDVTITAVVADPAAAYAAEVTFGPAGSIEPGPVLCC